MKTAFTSYLAIAACLAAGTAQAAPLIIDGANPTQTSCPGGLVVDGGRSCYYGGTHTFDYVDIRNGGELSVLPFDGVDKQNTGNVVIKATGLDPTSSFSIRVDARSRVTAKGAGYRGLTCDNGEGPNYAPLAGGRGGCAVRDSGGGGAHFGRGGRGTKDCQLYGSPISCEFPQEWEENCGRLSGGACQETPQPGAGTCWGVDNSNGGGDALPDVAGQPFYHSIFDPEFGAAGGDKGCRDGFDSALRAGDGGGRIVLFAALPGANGVLSIDGRVSADGNRGCASGNDSAGGGAGGTVLIIGDTVRISETARVSAHGGRGGDSQPKCLPCNNPGSQDVCESGQVCTAMTDPASGRTVNLCNPCNCTRCRDNADCTFPGQTCKNLGGALGTVCADANNQCTPYDVGDNEVECRGTQNSGQCDDCGGGGGGGIINVQSRQAVIDPRAIFDVRGAIGGICPICAGEAGGGAGELQLDSAYVGEICDGKDNDFDGEIDEDLPLLNCPGGPIPSCANGVPQECDYDPQTCTIAASDARPRFALVLDSSGSMLNNLQGYPTFGDGSQEFPGVDTNADSNNLPDDSRLFIAKSAVAKVLAAFPENDYALARYHQDVGLNRSCQTASNFECAMSCCSYDDPTNNQTPAYPDYYPGNRCVLSDLYPQAGYSFPEPGNSTDIQIGWSTPTADCINYAGSCGTPRRGADFLVGFGAPVTTYLSWLDGGETNFIDTTDEGAHCAGGDCELRATGPTPLAGALQATEAFLKPVVTCDGARECRSYAAILLTDGAESCQGDPVAAAAALRNAIPGKEIKTYVIGFSVTDSERAQLNLIAEAGGTHAGEFTGGPDHAFFAQNEDDLANAIATIIASTQVFEVCNDLDDDCDSKVDEDFPDKGQPCDDGKLGACRGTGSMQCDAAQTGTVCVITNPGAEPTDEVCNGIDDNCNGLVDEGLSCSDCEPSPEVCNGKDDDCDRSVDEEPDVSNNDPEIGGACGELTSPHDQPPCQLGTVKCINGAPLCVGYRGPGTEMCNGLDEDCDGVPDNDAPCPEGTSCIEGRCVAPCGVGEFPCPGGLECRNGYCFPRDCEDVICPDEQTCINGVCVTPKPDGGTPDASPDSGDKDSGQDAETTHDAAGQDDSGQAGSAGGATSEQAQPQGNYGLTTGGGGCSCRTTGHGDRSLGAWIIGSLAAAWAMRRVRRNQKDER